MEEQRLELQRPRAGSWREAGGGGWHLFSASWVKEAEVSTEETPQPQGFPGSGWARKEAWGGSGGELYLGGLGCLWARKPSRLGREDFSIPSHLWTCYLLALLTLQADQTLVPICLLARQLFAFPPPPLLALSTPPSNSQNSLPLDSRKRLVQLCNQIP